MKYYILLVSLVFSCKTNSPCTEAYNRRNIKYDNMQESELDLVMKLIEKKEEESKKSRVIINKEKNKENYKIE